MENFNLFSFLSQFSAIKRLVIAFSGGLDSSVLLSLLANDPLIRQGYTLIAVHVNHQLSPSALRWSEHCRSVAKNYNISYYSETISLDLNYQESLEAQARERRYAVLSKYMGDDTALLTAHHQDDQAETVLLQLCRGTGVTGLCAMPSVKLLKQGLHLRPLLSVSRADLLGYALSQSLVWIEDESNENIDFDRNFLRHQVMPLLQSRWKAVNQCFQRMSYHLSEAEVLLKELAQADLVSVSLSESKINIEKLQSLSYYRQKNCLRYWLKETAKIIPDEKNLEEIFNTVIRSRYDLTPSRTWDEWILRRYRQALYLEKKEAKNTPDFSIRWDLKDDLILPFGRGVLKLEDFSAYISQAPLIVCQRQAGMRVYLAGRAGRRTMKSIFQSLNIPPWDRDRMVLILLKETLIAVVSSTGNISYLIG
jgi:tRNA(Ile)-lysidine synthase